MINPSSWLHGYQQRTACSFTANHGVGGSILAPTSKKPSQIPMPSSPAFCQNLVIMAYDIRHEFILITNAPLNSL
jgi:hypothetical protein